jgi:hypothetical protein
MPDEKYLRFVRSYPCIQIRGGGFHSDVAPHHLRNNPHTRRHVDRGNVVPLCFQCHRWVHDNPKWERDNHERLKQIALEIEKDYGREHA